MSISRGTILEEAPAPTTRYVYIKMVTAQADTEEGKLRRGDVLMVPEDKAQRWCWRARIAVPATPAEYQRFREKFIRSRNGSFALPGNMRRNLMDIPEESGFSYVDDSDPSNAEAHDDVRTKRRKGELSPQEAEQAEYDLAQQLMEAESESEDDDDEEEEDDDELDLPPDPQPVRDVMNRNEAPVFDASIQRGPESSRPPTSTSRPPARAAAASSRSRGRSGASQRKAQGNSSEDKLAANAKSKESGTE